VTALDVCARKSIVASAAADNSIYIWNYLGKTLELMKQFSDDITAVAVHPSGLQMLVGFSDKLRFMNILLDDMRTFHEFPVRSCKMCRFSTGGNMLAAAHGNVVEVYHTYTLQLLGTLKGHNGKVQSLSWNKDDTRIVTCGVDGAVYEWDARTMARVAESVMKSNCYTSGSFGSDGKSVFAVGSDKTLKYLSGGVMQAEIQTANASSPVSCVLTQVLLCVAQLRAVYAMLSGCVLCVYDDKRLWYK
jgi:cilia- and flagella-associated protein 57